MHCARRTPRLKAAHLEQARPAKHAAGARRPAAPTAAALLQHALECQAALDLHGALLSLERARQLEPANAPVLALASKVWTDHTYLDDVSRGDIKRVNEKAIALARRAQAADGRYAPAHCAECVCKGRLAEFEERVKVKLALAKEAQDAAYRALERDQNDDFAHHLIGRWNKGMADLNFLVKQVIKHVFGTEFRPGTNEGARAAYEEAVRLRPDRLVHKVELARVLADMGQKQAAAALIQVRFHGSGCAQHMLLSFCGAATYTLPTCCSASLRCPRMLALGLRRPMLSLAS